MFKITTSNYIGYCARNNKKNKFIIFFYIYTHVIFILMHLRTLFEKIDIPVIVFEARGSIVDNPTFVCVQSNDSANLMFNENSPLTNMSIDDFSIFGENELIAKNMAIAIIKQIKLNIQLSTKGGAIANIISLDDNHVSVIVYNFYNTLEEYDQYILQAKQHYKFLAHMSHEIRTPLNGVIGAASLLGDTELTQEQANYLDILQQSGINLMSIVNDILDLSKLETGNLILNSSQFSISKCVESSIDVISPIAMQKGIELQIFIDNKCPEFIIGDYQRLCQILVNLLSNGVKFTSEGSVQIRVECVSQGSDDCTLQFSITDTGIGIDKKDYPKLFKPFMQIDQSVTKQYEGTGLGLIITRKLLQLMGGDIWFESNVGIGTTFTFSINCKKSSDNIIADTSLKGLTVLIVDDKPLNRQYMQKITSDAGMIALLFTSASEIKAFIKYYPNKIDLALIDICMPSEDGNSLAREIKSMGKTFPLIALSSFSDKVSPSDKNLFSAYITKPIHEEFLINTIKHCISKESYPTQILPAHKNTPKFNKLRILVAEDISLNRQVVRGILEKLKYKENKIVTDGIEALKELSHKDYDIVILDIKMPRMSGIEAVKEIRKKYNGKTRPYLIALTAAALSNDKELALSAGFDHYITKPVDIQKIYAELETSAKLMYGCADFDQNRFK